MSQTLPLSPQSLPQFSSIDPAQIEQQVDDLLNANRQTIDSILQTVASSGATMENFLMPMDELNDALSKLWSPIGHLNGVMNTDQLREAYNACLPKLSKYWTELGQNQALYSAYKSLSESDSFNQASLAQRKVVTNALRDFHLSGIDLAPEQQQRYGEISQRLSELSSKFSENVLDCTKAFSFHTDDVSVLDGLPDTQLKAAEHAAKEQGETGYLLSLDLPNYVAVVSYCHNRELRHRFYEAFSTRASDQGPFDSRWDNTELMHEILSLRHEMAQLLGFKNYAERSLATKMTESPEQVMQFLHDLAAKAKPVAEQEFAELRQFATEKLGITDLQAWDVSYCSEKLKQDRYEISQEELRPWFPQERVLAGLFEILQRLFQMRFERDDQVDRYHPDVHFYRVYQGDEEIAGCYLDLFARTDKRGGAWMDECQVRRRTSTGEVQKPVAYLTCNFHRPVGDAPALLTHSEVTTLFHEFGHGIHHMLTQVEESAVSGINGVPWDAVELPSQFLENWCWHKESIALMSGHYETGEPLPADLLDRLLAAKNFQSAVMMMRQLEFSLFDFDIHLNYRADINVHQQLQAVREQVAVFMPPEFNRFECSFTHIFAGGYAAGYYSYKWAEVLSADAFSRFEDEGVFSPEAGNDFLKHILQQGGAEEPMVLFKRFRGREPEVDALLRHSGLAA